MHFRHWTRGKDAPVSMGWCVKTYCHTWPVGNGQEYGHLQRMNDAMLIWLTLLQEDGGNYFRPFFFWVCMFSLYLLSYTVQRHINVRQWCQWKSGSMRNKLDNTDRCVIVLAVTCVYMYFWQKCLVISQFKHQAYIGAACSFNYYYSNGILNSNLTPKHTQSV